MFHVNIGGILKNSESSSLVMREERFSVEIKKIIRCHFKCYFKLNILFNTFVTGNHGKDGIVMPKKNLKITPKTLSAI